MKAFVNRVKNKEPGVKLMGFGHRVYKHYDPRAAIVKKATADVLERLGKVDPLLDLAIELEQIALADDYFIERKLYPNVDFYSGVIYKAMGFPTADVHRAVRDRAAARLDRALARDDGRPRHPDRPTAPGLHRRHRARLRRHGGPRLSRIDVDRATAAARVRSDRTAAQPQVVQRQLERAAEARGRGCVTPIQPGEHVQRDDRRGSARQRDVAGLDAGWLAEQLGREHRPHRVAIAAGQLDAAQAGRTTRQYERADHRRGLADDDRQMRPVPDASRAIPAG